MVNIDVLDNELYNSIYVFPRIGDYKEVWSRIRSNKEVLREAVQVTKDKFGERDIVKGLSIAELILLDYDNIDLDIYNDLINTIYSNIDIARIVLYGASNGGDSFLLMSLLNPNLKLTEEQKAFAVNEAMNKLGTTRYSEIKIDNYFQRLSYMMSTKQAHGVGAFDIRYYILKNSNWSLEEKKKLVMDFWYDDEAYDECLNIWEWNIINDNANYKGNSVSQFNMDYLYEYSYNDLLLFYKDKKTTARIWNEIEFCKLMHKIRPQICELEYKSKIKTI